MIPEFPGDEAMRVTIWAEFPTAGAPFPSHLERSTLNDRRFVLAGA